MGAESGPAEEKQVALWGNIEVAGAEAQACWKYIVPFPQQRNTTAAQNLKRSPALARAMGGKHIPAHMITRAPAHTLTLNIIQAFLNETLWQTCFKHTEKYMGQT